MLPTTIMGELGLFTENDSCSISTDLTFDFDGIGEGIPASLQCDLDFYNFLSLDADLPAYFVAKMFTGDPDYNMLPALCENDGYDFFTYNATATCNGASSCTGGSYCLPESCTGNEQLVASLRSQMNESSSHKDNKVLKKVYEGASLFFSLFTSQFRNSFIDSFIVFIIFVIQDR